MSYQQNISQLFLNLENEVGVTRMDDLVLDALYHAIHDFQERGEEDFFQQFMELSELVKNTQPRIAIIIDHFYHLWVLLSLAKKTPHQEGHLYWERKIIQCLRDFRKDVEKEKEKMIFTGVKEIANNDVILIHSLSSSVLETLFHAKKAGKKFRVIVAEQEVEKTQKMIESLTSHEIHFQVIPEYMLSHIEDEVTKVFLGAVTMNSNHYIVCDAGMNAIVSEFHLKKTPIYLFILSRKFSLWQSSESHHRYKVTATKTHGYKPISFERIKFSHDRVHYNFFDFFITESGKLTPEALYNWYQKKYDEREDWRKEFFEKEDEK